MRNLKTYESFFENSILKLDHFEDTTDKIGAQIGRNSLLK